MFPIFSHPSDLESLRIKFALEPCWKKLYQVFLTTPAVRLQGLEPCVYISQLQRASLDSWNFTPARDLILKLTREVLPQKQMASWGRQLSEDHRARFSSSIWNLYSFCLFPMCFFSLLMLGKKTHLNSELSLNPRLRPCLYNKSHSTFLLRWF